METFDGLIAYQKAHPRSGAMTRFRISELSGVTKPAQTGAKAVFIKRAAEPLRDPAPDPAIRKAAVLAAVEAMARAKSATSGMTYEKAFTELVLASRDVAEALI